MSHDRAGADVSSSGPDAPRPGSVLTAPGKDLTFLSAPPDHIRFREDVGPDAAPVPLHRHLAQTERFTVLEGELDLTVAGRLVRLSPGESLEVGPGVLHTYAPSSAGGAPGSALIEVELWPADDVHLFFEVIYGMTRECRIPPRGFRDVIALLALGHAHRFVVGGRPVLLKRIAAAFAAALAAVFRIEPWAPRYAARVSEAAATVAIQTLAEQRRS